MEGFQGAGQGEEGGDRGELGWSVVRAKLFFL